MQIPAPFLYNAWVLSVHDGDTLTVKVDRGNKDYSEWNIRVLGLNARELAQDGGKEAASNLQTLLPVGTQVVLETVKPDKYAGRYDAKVWFSHGGQVVELTPLLIQTQWAAAWNGEGARPLPPWPRQVA